MNAVEDVLRRYEEAEKDTETSLVEGYTHVYGYRNQSLRNALRKEYVGLLPLNKRVAIMLHSELCSSNHTDACGFFYEVKGIVDNWDQWTHKLYLKRADALLEALRKAGVEEEKLYDTACEVIHSTKVR